MERINLIHYPPEEDVWAALDALRAEVGQLTEGFRKMAEASPADAGAPEEAL